MVEKTEVYEAPRWTISYGYTMNLGNFTSLRVDIGLSDSRLPNENAEDAFTRIDELVSAKFIERINEERSKLEELGLA